MYLVLLYSRVYIIFCGKYIQILVCKNQGFLEDACFKIKINFFHFLFVFSFFSVLLRKTVNCLLLVIFINGFTHINVQCLYYIFISDKCWKILIIQNVCRQFFLSRKIFLVLFKSVLNTTENHESIRLADGLLKEDKSNITNCNSLTKKLLRQILADM